MNYINSLVMAKGNEEFLVDYDFTYLYDGDCMLTIISVFKFSHDEDDWVEYEYTNFELSYFESKILDHETSERSAS